MTLVLEVLFQSEASCDLVIALDYGGLNVELVVEPIEEVVECFN